MWWIIVSGVSCGGPVVYRSCDWLLIGKTYWKSVVQPRVLSASSVVVWSRQEKAKLQVVENRVWRQILGAPMYTPVAALQGEIGASTVEGRDRKIKLGFGLYMFKTGNGLLRAIFRRMCEEIRPGRWMRQLREYMGELGIGFDRLKTMTKLELNRVVDEWETDRWRRDLESRTTLQLYRNKVGIGDEGIYRNVFGSVLKFRCRTKTLKFRWRDGFSGCAVDCLLCGAEVEHFVMKCEGIRTIWERHGVRGGVRVEEMLLCEGGPRKRLMDIRGCWRRCWRREID